ncbi:sensor of ECF-type sigma factor [Aestuariivivens insulae]|uniref:sensor of ECF-type sigma factor n=1 Tax=Aestuariivivens insulae TaxID=1621988 RepID=UPI001F58C933|nr:sensor of ECF-type sigma factor [Aestuariivivens insulae]
MKNYILSLYILLFTAGAFAQPKREEIKALKVSFITERLSLTEKEAQAFWPIYNTFEENTMLIKHKELRSIRKEIKQNLSTLSENDAKALLDRLTMAQDKLQKENKILISKLKSILPAQKILMLKIAEEDFKRKLFEQYKRHRPEHQKK